VRRRPGVRRARERLGSAASARPPAMIFTSTDFFLFYALVFTLYWAVRV
jgi:hypothetical protein